MENSATPTESREKIRKKGLGGMEQRIAHLEDKTGEMEYLIKEKFKSKIT